MGKSTQCIYSQYLILKREKLIKTSCVARTTQEFFLKSDKIQNSKTKSIEEDLSLFKIDAIINQLF